MKALTAIVTLAVMLIAAPPANAQIRGTTVHKTANQFIAGFKQGKDFESGISLQGIVFNQRISPSALLVLRRELLTGSTEVRENIVKLLREIGLALDTPSPDQIRIIRDHAVIRALAGEGFAKDDIASDAAAKILIDYCKPSDLAAANDLYVRALKEGIVSHIYIAAKAKTAEARPFVEKLALLPDSGDDPDDNRLLKIAQAALGNEAVETEFIDALEHALQTAPPAPPNHFYDVGAARDGSEAAKRLHDLGQIGTQRTLLVACSLLRSPLKSYVPNISERSIRNHALDAIRYNFPDERILYEPTGLTQWQQAEKFCSTRIGAKFDGSTPEIPAARIYPRFRPSK